MAGGSKQMPFLWSPFVWATMVAAVGHNAASESDPGLAPCYCCGDAANVLLEPQRLHVQRPPSGLCLLCKPGRAGEGVWKGRSGHESHQEVPKASDQVPSEHCLWLISFSSSFCFLLSFSKSFFGSFYRLRFDLIVGHYLYEWGPYFFWAHLPAGSIDFVIHLMEILELKNDASLKWHIEKRQGMVLARNIQKKFFLNYLLDM